MTTFDPYDLDRTLERAAQAERRWRRDLRRDPASAGDDAWFQAVRWVTTRATFEEISALPVSDPLREPRRRWVYRLALARIAQPAVVEACRARASVLHLEKPEVTTIAAGDLVRRALADSDTARRAVWLDGLAEAGERVRSAERRAAQAFSEISIRLGVTEPETLTSPYDGVAVREACRTLLAVTGDLAGSRLGSAEDLSTLIGALVCRDVNGSWPTHASSRWLFELFAGTPLLDGITFDLGPLPALLGAATFTRAFARFGAAWSRAASGRTGPLVIAQDATEASPLRYGALFAALLTNPVFLERRFEFSRETARSVGRALAVPSLAHARLHAARALFDLRAMPVRDAREVLEDALKVRIDEGMIGLLPKLGDRAPVRLAATLLAQRDAVVLRDTFDEDWFDNPRALRALREQAALPPPLLVAKEEVEASVRPFAVWLESLSSS